MSDSRDLRAVSRRVRNDAFLCASVSSIAFIPRLSRDACSQARESASNCSTNCCVQPRIGAIVSRRSRAAPHTLDIVVQRGPSGADELVVRRRGWEPAWRRLASMGSSRNGHPPPAGVISVTAAVPAQIGPALDRSDPTPPRMTFRCRSSAVPETRESNVRRSPRVHPKPARRTD